MTYQNCRRESLIAVDFLRLIKIKGLVGVSWITSHTVLNNSRAVDDRWRRCFESVDYWSNKLATFFLLFPLIELDLEIISANWCNVMHWWRIEQRANIFAVSYSIFFGNRWRLKNLKRLQDLLFVQNALTYFLLVAQMWFRSSVKFVCLVKFRWRPLVTRWLRTPTVQLWSGWLLLRIFRGITSGA